MKQIQLKELISGRRVGYVQMGGFELQAPKSASMKEEGFVTRKGELSLNFKVTIPPSGLFSIPDTQHNRLKLRKMVVASSREEKSENYNFKTKETDIGTQTLESRAAMEVLNDVKIHEDLFVPKTVYTEDEMETLFKERMKKGSKKSAKKAPKEGPKKGQVVQETPGEDKTPDKPFVQPDRFAGKVPAQREVAKTIG